VVQADAKPRHRWIIVKATRWPEDLGGDHTFPESRLWETRPISNDKRACIDWSGHLPGGRLPRNLSLSPAARVVFLRKASVLPENMCLWEAKSPNVRAVDSGVCRTTCSAVFGQVRTRVLSAAVLKPRNDSCLGFEPRGVVLPSFSFVWPSTLRRPFDAIDNLTLRQRDEPRIKLAEVVGVAHCRTMLDALKIEVNDLVDRPAVKQAQHFGKR
jgi:hypothetical protein